MKYLAIDPGLATGVTVLAEDGGIEGLELQPREFVMWLEGQLVGLRAEQVRVICEDFHITINTAKMDQKAMRWPWELLGATRSACWRLLSPQYEVTVQDPWTVKKFIPDPILKRYGWYSIGSDHVRDSSRHLLSYCLTHDVVAARRPD